MFNGLPSSRRIACSHELGVLVELVQHAKVFATHRTMHHLGACPLCDRARCANGHRAVDDREGGPETFDIAGCFTDEVADLEGIADVQNIDLTDWLWRRRKVYANGIVTLAHSLKKRFPDFAKSGDDNLLFFHDCQPPVQSL
jgi:hypothetical protein